MAPQGMYYYVSEYIKSQLPCYIFQQYFLVAPNNNNGLRTNRNLKMLLILSHLGTLRIIIIGPRPENAHLEFNGSYSIDKDVYLRRFLISAK